MPSIYFIYVLHFIHVKYTHLPCTNQTPQLNIEIIHRKIKIKLEHTVKSNCGTENTFIGIFTGLYLIPKIKTHYRKIHKFTYILHAQDIVRHLLKTNRIDIQAERF